MNKHSLRSAVLAIALTFGTSATMTVAHSFAAPTVAEAGVLGKIGGAVKRTAKGFGAAAKAGAHGVVFAGKRIGEGVGGGVKRGAVAAGKAIKNHFSPPPKRPKYG